MAVNKEEEERMMTKLKGVILPLSLSWLNILYAVVYACIMPLKIIFAGQHKYTAKDKQNSPSCMQEMIRRHTHWLNSTSAMKRRTPLTGRRLLDKKDTRANLNNVQRERRLEELRYKEMAQF